jgi:hypothetical protein
MVVAYALCFVILGLALRSRTLNAKAYGRLALGIGFLAWSATVGFSTWRNSRRVEAAKTELVEAFMQATVSAAQPTSGDNTPLQAQRKLSETQVDGNATDKQVAFIKGVKIRVTKWVTDAGELERKFAEIDLSDVLTPENLTSPAAIISSKQKLSQLQALISKRNVMLQRYMKGNLEYFQTTNVDEPTRREAISSFNAGKDSTLKAYDELGNAQLASLQSIQEMLNFAENSLGRTSVENSQIVFETQHQLEQYQSISTKIQQTAAHEEAVTKKMAELRNASRRTLVSEYN